MFFISIATTPFIKSSYPIAGRELFESWIALDIFLDVFPHAGERHVGGFVEQFVERSFLLLVEDFDVSFVQLLFLLPLQRLDEIPALILAQNALGVAP